MRPTSQDRSGLFRLALACGVAVGLVVTAITVPSYSFSRTTSVADSYGATRPVQAADGHWHRHDPARKNDLSQSDEVSGSSAATASTQDPTTSAEARRNAAYVAESRNSRDPELRRVSLRSPRRTVPENRYAVAGGCYTVAGTPIRFQATDLGVNLLYTTGRRFLSATRAGAVTPADKPSVAAEWITRRTDEGFTFRLADGRWLTGRGAAMRTGSEPTAYPLHTTGGCPTYPEVQVNVSGSPHAGVSPFQEVRGYIDAHVHGMAFEFLGGKVHCGKPWDKYGAPYALVDCPDHELTNGNGALLESVLSGEASHDPTGWPTFKDWPAPKSLTHEGTYYKWMERAWRGGQRIFVNLLVENGKLCQIYPMKKNSCDDMESAKLQAKDMRAMERYIDARYGGPGKGWYRIVTSPEQARRVINQGKLAVVMGIEVSIPFGCTMKLDIPQCDRGAIKRQLTDLHDMGVRQMELVNKFDNALSGVAGDEGAVGVAVNLANFLETGSFWNMKHCEPADGESADRTQLGLPDISGGQQDALFGALVQVAGLGLPALPLYGTPLHCNQRGLTDLGSYAIDQLMAKKMLIDPDHMSVKGRQAALTRLEQASYSGVVSSHSWSTPDAYPRIYDLGGFVAPMAGDSTGFLEKWQRHLGWADKRFYFGFGYGADINGLAEQGLPRGADAADKVTYPITGMNGVRIGQQRSGERVYDINIDGVAHYGLYPDWIEDLRRIGGASQGTAIVEDLSRGPEAYLQTWERAQGIAPDSCRNPELRRTPAAVRRLVQPGMTTTAVMRKVGQPWTRLGRTYGICARTASKQRVPMTITFSRSGRVTSVRLVTDK
ncbi:peptidase [Nocardioides sp. JQ2195]|uniref:peptidase n=1 Tax=Nocardioides sp. JQ2195 TaxID=2592334 RepID=UPI00143EA2E7|nr:peptidase [Nocardioides sp. JQ2195]QIX25354.1 peptidase [Nocardioides sp. JQ2195]